MKRSTTIVCVLASLLVLAGCGSGGGRASGLNAVTPYKADSPYYTVIKPCALADKSSRSCSLTTLPAIGMDTDTVTIDDIMNRVLVSHAWMGRRFEELLNELPNDLIQLFGGVTAVVIGAEIRPSYYWGLTGAIYLDPANLWLVQAEKSVISREQDYREAFADPMGFRSFWQYSKGNSPAFTYYGLDSTQDRAIQDIVIPMASLLFHELAHANDFLPPTEYDNIVRTQSIANATNSSTTNSDILSTMFALTSAEWATLASILYSGVTPSEADLARTPEEVGAFFESDDASDDYAYTSQYEDLAMLFEEAMMKKHFDVDRNMAFVSNPDNVSDCNDHKVGWGVRNRIGDPEVKSRAAWVIAQLLPESDNTEFLASLPAPQSLEVGAGWCNAVKMVPAGAVADERIGDTPFHVQQMLRPYLPVERN